MIKLAQAILVGALALACCRRSANRAAAVVPNILPANHEVLLQSPGVYNRKVITIKGYLFHIDPGGGYLLYPSERGAYARRGMDDAIKCWDFVVRPNPDVTALHVEITGEYLVAHEDVERKSLGWLIEPSEIKCVGENEGITFDKTRGRRVPAGE